MEITSNRKKLLLVGSTISPVHLKSYYHLVKDYFDEILIVTNCPIDFCKYEIVDFSVKRPFRIAGNIKSFRRIMNSFNPSVIHVHQANSCAYITTKANQKKYPLVLTIWGSDVLLLPQKGFIFKYLVKYSLKRADAITADANYIGSVIQKLGVRKEINVANFGIDLGQVIIPPKENIIYSNRLHNELYNIDQVINSFSDFVKEFPQWKLIVGGNGKKTEDLKKLAKNCLPENSYEFIGFVDKEENQRQYLRAKIWISIPSSDGTAISLLEAMTYGCVPVVSDLPANSEWITEGVNGCIVRDGIVQGLREAAGLPIAKVQEINSKIIQAKATKKVNKAIFESIYDRIIRT